MHGEGHGIGKVALLRILVLIPQGGTANLGCRLRLPKLSVAHAVGVVVLSGVLLVTAIGVGSIRRAPGVLNARFGQVCRPNSLRSDLIRLAREMGLLPVTPCGLGRLFGRVANATQARG